jgi:hypothetical protein
MSHINPTALDKLTLSEPTDPSYITELYNPLSTKILVRSNRLPRAVWNRECLEQL